MKRSVKTCFLFLLVAVLAFSTALQARADTAEPDNTQKVQYGSVICTLGPRLRDLNLAPYNTDRWYMFTPFDASEDGTQTFQLIGGSKYEVGSAALEVRDGTVTLTYELYHNVDITVEFFTILNELSDLTEYEPEALAEWTMVPGHPYSIAEDFCGDTNLVLYFCSRANFVIGNHVLPVDLGTDYRNLCRRLLTMMDK